ncbi:MAG: 1-acyl-sn-glycerol-3-phosphate acyltransferase [Comamonadaceae bacterium]|nr:MAG: 1-acyl-sn-glycerol-3-phosphate acyltransferase [Comamonadaceae bacterium]
MRLALHLVSGLITIHFVFPKLSQAQKQERIQAWALSLLAQIAIKFEVHGEAPQHGPVLLVANHVSWLDIVVLLASCPCRFVSKVEVGRWPVIGTLTHAAGTLFIARESRRDALRVVHQMAQALQADTGMVLTIFPEGTTSNGLQVLPFHANLFQAAISANAPVQAVALRFEDAATGASSLAACYIDQDTLVGSVWRTLKSPELCVKINFGETQHAQDRDRRTWAAEMRSVVDRLRTAN